MDKAERNKLAKQGIWVDKHGIQTHVSDMGVEHMCNILKRMIKDAQHKEERIDYMTSMSMYAALGSLSGEMAQYTVESEIDAYEQEGEGYTSWTEIIEREPFFPSLKEEFEKRELYILFSDIWWNDKHTYKP